jgi:hypothetical protein
MCCKIISKDMDLPEESMGYSNRLIEIQQYTRNVFGFCLTKEYIWLVYIKKQSAQGPNNLSGSRIKGVDKE